MVKIATIVVLLVVIWFGFNSFSSKDAAAQRMIDNDIAILSKAVRAHKTRKGNYPENLKGLENGFLLKLPTDPYGKPYRYTLDEGGAAFSISASQ